MTSAKRHNCLKFLSRVELAIGVREYLEARNNRFDIFKTVKLFLRFRQSINNDKMELNGQFFRVGFEINYCRPNVRFCLGYDKCSHDSVGLHTGPNRLSPQD